MVNRPEDRFTNIHSILFNIVYYFNIDFQKRYHHFSETPGALFLLYSVYFMLVNNGIRKVCVKNKT